MEENTNGGGDTQKPRPSDIGNPSKIKSNRPKTSIPRPKPKRTANARSSVIYADGPPRHTGASHTVSANANLGHFRTPWVPAPGKSTTFGTTHPDHKHDPIITQAMSTTSSSSITSFGRISPNKSKVRLPISSKRASKTTFSNQNSKTDLKRDSKKKNRPSGYTLKSKDSLVDVTAFLHSKRDEIMKLWEDNLLNDDPELLAQFEKANALAIDAAKEVEILHKSIQDLYKKDSSLSEGDCEMLDELRKVVLIKVKSFEEVNSRVHQMLSNHISELPPKPQQLISEASRSNSGAIKSLGSTKASRSRSDQSGQSVRKKEVIVLKEKSPNFREETEDSEFEEQIIDVEKVKTATTTTSNTTTQTASTAPSTTADLNKLTQLYNENYEFPPTQSNLNVKGSPASAKQSKSRFVRFEQEKDAKSNDEKSHNYCFKPQESTSSSSQVQVRFYREKVNELQRQLMETEAEMEEMKGDLQRVESDSNFKVRMLKSSFEDRLDTLESFPEYLQVTEKRLFDTMESKVQLERVLGEKDKEIGNLKEANETIKREMNELKDKLRTSENSRDFLGLKVTELERGNQSLRNEVEEKKSQIEKLTHKLEWSSQSQGNNRDRPKSAEADHNISNHQSFQNERLELECIDLKDRLSKALKTINLLQISKKKLSNRSLRRQEEILEQFEEVRAKNRHLLNQIHYIRNSYYELFPKEMFNPMKANNNKSPKSKKNSTMSKVTIFEPPEEEVDEPIATKTTTWKTGVKKNASFVEIEDVIDDDADGYGTYTVDD